MKMPLPRVRASFACTVVVFLLAASAHAVDFTVTNTNDSGPGSLRQAILDANAARGANIHFAIGSGEQSIRPLSPLPATAFGGTIDGRTQPGFAGSPLIEIDCSLLTGSFPRCVNVGAGGVVRSLAVNNSPGYGLDLGQSAIYGSYIGLAPDGQTVRSNAWGIACRSCAVGSPVAGDGNVISGNSIGVQIQHGGLGAPSSIVAANLIGTDATGTKPLGNSYGVYLQSTGEAGVTIGGATAAHGNIISGNSTAIYLWESPHVTIRHNTIGLGAGAVAVPNSIGIDIQRSSDNLVQGNAIWRNTRSAIEVDSTGGALRNTFVNNSIYANNFGIDLRDPSSLALAPTPNDAGDGDSGPNNYQNFPVISKVTSAGGTTRIIGTLDSRPNESYSIELFSNPTCHGSGYGEGRSSIATTNVTTNGSGLATFDLTLAFPLGAGSGVAALATNDLEGTSEFSPCAIVEGHGVLALAGPTSADEHGTATVTVLREAGTVGAVTVTWSAGGGSAQNGIDYSAPGGVLSFADGESSKSFTIPMIDDAIYEGLEDFVVTLSNPTGGATIDHVRNMEHVEIRENDQRPTVSSAFFYVPEGNAGTSNAVFPVHLSVPAAIPISVKYTTFGNTATANSDFQHTAGTLVFAPGETAKTVSVPIFGDTIWESHEQFRLALSSNYGFAEGWATIVNDDSAPTASIEDLTVVEGEGDKTVIVTVRASQPTSEAVLVAVRSGSARSPSDYRLVGGTIVRFQGTVAPIAISIVDDELVEADETFTVRIFNFGQIEIARAEATVTIVNDDTGVGPAEQRIGVGETGSYGIELGIPVVAQSVVELESSNPSVIAVPASITIRPGDRRTGFEARALALGSAVITVRLPDGTIHHVTATTYIHYQLALTPPSLNLFTGQTISVTASLQPVNDQPVTVTLETLGDTVTVPASITIPPHATTTFDVAAVKEGPIVIHASVGSSDAGTLFGHVAETPSQPTIFRLSSTTGPTAGGTLLHVTGIRFERNCEVLFGGIPARSVQYFSDTTMAVTTPAHDEGTVDVLLACAGSVSIFPNGFTFVAAAPELSAVTHVAGNVAGGTEVRIDGSHFRSSCWPFFGGVAAPAATVLDPSTMTATTPPHAAGAVDLTLRCTEGEALLEKAFTFVTTPDPAARIDDVDPRAGAPGQEVVLEGLHFRRSNPVTFGGVPATILATQRDRQVVRVPELPPGRTDVTVGETTTGPIFTVLEAVPPFIMDVLPAEVPAGAELTLEGRGFRPGYVFLIGGRAATVASLAYTRIVLRVDAETEPGTHAIEVLNAAGQLAGIGPDVTVTEDGLALFSIDVPCTTTAGDVLATLTGRGFAAGAMVTFDGAPMEELTVVDATTIRGRIPPGEAGPATIRVGAATLTSKFRYASPFDPAGCGGGRSRSVRH